jgi:uncharacterized protein with PIN domain
MEQATTYRVVFQFHGELNDFLPRRRRHTRFVHSFDHRASIKDVVESLGVPHTEVDLILVHGRPVDFGYIVRDGNVVDVYPASAATATRAPVEARLSPPPLPEPRFILDAHLGKLAAYLRLLGFDTLYRNDYHDEELARVSAEELRILLTRDRNLLKRGVVAYGYFVRETTPRRQVVEILRRFNLVGVLAPYRRCIRCNGLLEPVTKAEVLDQLAPKTRLFFDEFHRCLDCGQIYWKGSHYEPLQQFIERVLQNEGAMTRD